MKAWLLLACVLSQGVWALAPCQSDTAVGNWCEIGIDALHPTQGGVGQIQVDETQATLAGMSAKQLDKLMKKKEIPVVIAPDGGYWLVDRHHLTKALWQHGVKDARVKVIGRLQDKANFWSQMQNNHWAWLKDEKGLPLTPEQYVVVLIASVLGSFGTAGVPGTAVVMATVVLSAANLPLEAIGYLYAIDRILDMMRTMTNVTGQMVVPVIVAKETGLLDRQVYDAVGQKESGVA